MTENAELQKLLEKYRVNFHYDGQVWCLSGTSTDGNYYETDDLDAATLEEAEDQAIDYLVVYNED